jgi:hypothetical protein
VTCCRTATHRAIWRAERAARAADVTTASAESWIDRAGFRLKVLLSAAPLAFVALAYARVRATGEPFFGLDAKALGLGASIEFIVLHSIGFLGMLALIRPTRAEWAALKWLAVVLLGAMYLSSAYKMGGTQGLWLFLSLTFTTYLGFFLNFTTGGAALSLALRWIVSTLLLGVAMAIVGIEGDLGRVAWSSPREGLRFGQWFFGLLLLVELTGLYHLRQWQAWSEPLSVVHRDMFSGPRDSGTQKMRLAALPLLGTLVICALPLFAAQALGTGFFELFDLPVGKTLDERVASMRARGRLHDWGPLIATAALLAGRCAQIAWVVTSLRPDPERHWWQRRGLLALLAVVGTAYIAIGWWQASSGEMIVHGGASPGPLLEKFILAEMFVLLAMLPMTWKVIVRRLRGE